jgi:hypothetical protein
MNRWVDSGTGAELQPLPPPSQEAPPAGRGPTLAVHGGGLHRMILRDGALVPVAAVRAA